jgi:hypothetical protein
MAWPCAGKRSLGGLLLLCSTRSCASRALGCSARRSKFHEQVTAKEGQSLRRAGPGSEVRRFKSRARLYVFRLRPVWIRSHLF